MKERPIIEKKYGNEFELDVYDIPDGKWLWEIINRHYYIGSWGSAADGYTTKQSALRAGRNAAKRFGIKLKGER